MKKIYWFLSCLIVFSGQAFSQISGPATANVGAPVTFSVDSPDAGGVTGAAYSWNFGRTVDLNPTFTPVSMGKSPISIGGSLGYYASSVVNDKGNYYQFIVLTTGVARVNFGNNPANTPTVDLVTSTSANGGVDVVKDDVTGKWYAVSMWNSGAAGLVTLMDFGTDLSSTPTLSTRTFPGQQDVRQISLVKQNGNWMLFAIGWRVARIDFGNSLTNLTTTATATTLSTSVGGVGNANYSAFAQEDGKWYMIVGSYTGPVALYRVSFGADLMENAPVIKQLTIPAITGALRGFTLARTCDQVYGFMMQENGGLVKLDFKGTITTDAPVSVGTQTPYGTPGAFESATGFVYNDTFCIMSNDWNKNVYRAKMIPLVAEEHHYYNRSVTHTFTAPGTYDMTLTVNQGMPTGMSSYCKTVTVTAGPSQPGPYTAAPAKVCRGDAGVTYTVPVVSGATGYEWVYSGGTGVTFSGTSSTVGPTNNLTFNASATSGTLRVRAVNAGGQSTYRDTAIQVNVLPTVSVSPSTTQTICAGDSVTLTATASNVNFQWKRDGTTNVGTAAAYVAKTQADYAVTVTDKTTNCVATSGSVSVKVNALPTVTVSPSTTQTICDGDSVTLTATASNVNYQWKRNGTTNVGTDGTYKAKTQADYAVTVTDKTTNCVATSGSVSVKVNALPTVTVSPSTTQAICDGDSVTLTATASNVNYQWKRNGTTNVGTDGTYKAKTQGNYTVTVTDKTTSCVKTSGSVTVNVSSLPTVTLSPSTAQAICDGDSVVLTATASNVNYQWKLNGTTNIGTASTYTAKTGGSYAVTVTDKTSSCVKTSGSVTVTANPLPTATLSVGGTGIACAGDSVVLTAGQGSGYNYQWKNGSSNVGTNSRTYDAVTTGDYKVVVTDGATQCKDSTGAVTVTVLSRPSVTLDPGDTSFCEGGVVTLEVSTQDTGLTYVWKNDQAVVPLATASFLEINSTGVYRVIVGRSAVSGCEDSTNTVTVTVHPLPVPGVTWDGLTFHATPGYVSYQWETGGQGIAGSTDSTFQPASDGGYSVTVVDSNGCTGTSPVYNVTLGIGSTSPAAAVRVYPNPARDVVYIAAPVPVQATLCNMEGKILMQQSEAHEIDMRMYAAGVYMLRISDSRGVVLRYEKLVKNQ